MILRMSWTQNVFLASIPQMPSETVNYLSHLNPKQDALYHQPKEVRRFSPVEEKNWFCNATLGANTLDSIRLYLMSHCLRATTVTFLSERNCETRHIKPVNNHKSDELIESYNDWPSFEQQCKMSNVLSVSATQSLSPACSEDKENITTN